VILRKLGTIKADGLFDLVVSTDKKKPHIKKPLNAFMLYMKEMRAKVVAECTLKESAAINQILGRRVSKSSIWTFPILSKLFYIRVANSSVLFIKSS